MLRDGQQKTFTVQPVLSDKVVSHWHRQHADEGEDASLRRGLKLSLHENRQNALLILELVKKMAQRKISMKLDRGADPDWPGGR